jgi:hypothetical protein
MVNNLCISNYKVIDFGCWWCVVCMYHQVLPFGELRVRSLEQRPKIGAVPFESPQASERARRVGKLAVILVSSQREIQIPYETIRNAHGTRVFRSQIINQALERTCDSSSEKIETCDEVRPREVRLDGLGHSRAVQVQGPHRRRVALCVTATASVPLRRQRRRGPEKRRGDAEELRAVPGGLEDDVL